MKKPRTYIDFLRLPCIVVGCEEECTITDDIITMERVVQHGPNPEHSKVVRAIDIVQADDPMMYWTITVHDWLQRIHSPSVLEEEW